MSKMSEQVYAKIEDHLVNMVAGEAKPIDVDYAMHLIHSYTQERELEVWQEVLDAWDLEEYAKVRITELQAQLNKSKGE